MATKICEILREDAYVGVGLVERYGQSPEIRLYAHLGTPDDLAAMIVKQFREEAKSTYGGQAIRRGTINEQTVSSRSADAEYPILLAA